jgi:hypothetical protein
MIALMLTTGGIATMLWLLLTSQGLVHQVVMAAAIGVTVGGAIWLWAEVFDREPP